MKVKTALKQSRAQIRFLLPVVLIAWLIAIFTLSVVIVAIAAAALLFLTGEMINVRTINQRAGRNPDYLEEEIR